MVTYQVLVTLWFRQMKPKMDKQRIAPFTFFLTYLLAHDTSIRLKGLVSEVTIKNI